MTFDDSLSRLIEIRKNRESLRRYEYDAFGNRIGKRTEDGYTRYYYNAANQLVRTEGIAPKETYQYDKRGNLTAILQGKKVVNQYVYDETGRLTAAFNLKGEAARYGYDGLGNRVEKQEYLVDTLDIGLSIADFVQVENPVKKADFLLDLTK